VRERERLITRIRQIRRSDAMAKARSPSPVPPPADEIEALEQRVAHLEQLVQGLQDSVHREALRHDRRITELEARTQPAELSRALSQDARERGL